MFGITVQADASTQIYLYDSNGAPTNVSATCTYQGHHVYDLNANLIGTVDASNHILNSSGSVVGYVQPDPPDNP